MLGILPEATSVANPRVNSLPPWSGALGGEQSRPRRGLRKSFLGKILCSSACGGNREAGRAPGEAAPVGFFNRSITLAVSSRFHGGGHMRFDTPSSWALCPWATCFSSNQCRAGACRRGYEQLPGGRFCQCVEPVCLLWGVDECRPREIPICRPDAGEFLVVGSNADLHTIA